MMRAAWTLPPTRSGPLCFGFGGGGAAPMQPMTPPSTPPMEPPATPPGTPPVMPVATSGSASSLIIFTSLGMTFGCMSLPASIKWACGFTWTIWTTAGGGGGGSETSRTIFATAGFVAGCGSGACRHALAAPTIPGDDEGSSDTKTGVRSYHNPYHQGKGESTKHLAAHQEQDEHGKESQTAGQDRSRKSLIDGLVDHVSERLVAQQPVVLTDASEDDDRVVHGIADQSKQGRDDRKRNLKMQQREKTQGNQHIVKHG